MKKNVKLRNQVHNFISSSGSGTVNNYGSGSDFLISNGSGSASASQKMTVNTVSVAVPVPQHCMLGFITSVTDPDWIRSRKAKTKQKKKIVKKLSDVVFLEASL
jgi:hypothetical protein